MEITEWKNMVKEERQQKDMFFFSNYNSPIRFEERQLFEVLDYYTSDYALFNHYFISNDSCFINCPV
jgi:hypothetical protein